LGSTEYSGIPETAPRSSAEASTSTFPRCKQHAEIP
jgi:hypothetical protein